MSRRYTRLFVDNISSNADLKEIEKRFDRFGRVAVFDISSKDRSGYVEYEHSREATECIRGLDNAKIEGKRVVVEYAYRKRRDSHDSRDRHDRRESRHGSERHERRGDRYERRDPRDRDRDRDSGYKDRRSQIDYERRKVILTHTSPTVYI